MDSSMNVLVFNCGSSSLKYRLLAMPSERELAGGEAQRVGPRTTEPPRIVHRVHEREQVHEVEMPDHGAAFEQVMRLLTQDSTLVPDVVGHRVVHGATRFHRHAVVDEAALSDLEAIQDLAPLHNPPATRLIRACQTRYPDLPQAAVFDTAFHSTIPDYARTYALPQHLREELGIRKYGFHGISHQYVTGEAAKILGTPLDELNAVSCHLGSGGASLCAVVNGKSVDNTMGYSPLQGLIMSTRCGDLDPAIALRLLARSNGDAAQRLLNTNSGVLGLSGLSSDIRDVFARGAQGDADAPRMELTTQIYLWRIRKYLGAYLTVARPANTVIFTDTIGETVPQVRWAVCSDMDVFGLEIDPDLNANVPELPADVAKTDSAVRVLVVATNEELAIARYTYALLAHADRNTEKGVAS